MKRVIRKYASYVPSVGQKILADPATLLVSPPARQYVKRTDICNLISKLIGHQHYTRSKDRGALFIYRSVKGLAPRNWSNKMSNKTAGLRSDAQTPSS